MLNTPKKKLVSFLTAATLTAGVVTAPVTFGLGLGQPAVESYIGEPLRVRIPVSAASEAEIESLEVGIAGADWYQQAGMERDPVLDSLLVGIERTAEGANVVITSANSLNQVMLPLLLEISGPRMTLRKQISVLLSPDLAAQPEDPWQDPTVEVAGIIGTGNIASLASSAPAAGTPLTSVPVTGAPAADAVASSGGFEQGLATGVIAADAGTASVAPASAETRNVWPTTVRVQRGDSLSAIGSSLQIIQVAIRPRFLTTIQRKHLCAYAINSYLER